MPRSRCCGSIFAATTGRAKHWCCCLGNSGPSIARNVTVTFDPAPPARLDIKPILEILKQGIASLPPGRTMQSALGAVHNTSDWDATHGPIGYGSRQKDLSSSSLSPEYVISVDDLDGSRAAPPGHLCGCS